MTKHNFRLLDIYTDYLLSSFGATTATGLSRLLPELSHDQITRFLSQQPLSDRDLWKIVKPQVRAVQSPEACLILDDSVEEKPYTDESELISWHYDHSQGRTVKGINLLSALYLSHEVSLPVAFELIQKTLLATDSKTGKDKWVSPVTKNELARQMIASVVKMIASVVKKQIPVRYVLADVWFCAADNMVFIKNTAHKEFIFPLKSNRRVALSVTDKQRGCWKALSSLDFPPSACLTLYLEGVPFPLVVAREVFINEDGQEGALVLCSSDVSLSRCALFTIYQKRWKVEEYHKSLKSNAALAKSPTKLPHTQHNHVFASIVAFIKLESYRTATHLNHFALKAKLYHSAIQSAFQQLQTFKTNYPQVAITT
jgi:DDE superfamily endonuclease